MENNSNSDLERNGIKPRTGHGAHAPKLNKLLLKPADILKYFLSRFSLLIPTKEDFTSVPLSQVLNPFKPLKLLTRHQWNLFFCGFWCWTMDAFGYFCVSMNVALLAKDFEVSAKLVTWAITLVLMLRSVGAAFFGVLSDRYGRTFPLATIMLCLTALQIGLGFVKTFRQFLAVRALFGIFMGGAFGPACALALEDTPVEAHGVLSGIFQEGYAFGYLLVICFQRAITDNLSHTWRALMWFSAGPSFLCAVWALLIGETDAFKRHKETALLNHTEGAGSRFVKQAKEALKQYWIVCAYLVLLMAGLNFSSHGSQDLYPTLLSTQLGFSEDRSTVTNAVANLGAIAGGVIFGHLSSFIGRRLAIMICAVVGGAMIYPWAFVRGDAINAGAFFMQFFVQGAWAVAPIYLNELAPPAFRSFVAGMAYQLGNLASSASSTIEATIGERFPLYDDNGNKLKGKYNYSKVMAIFMGCVFAYLLIITFVGPENRGADLSFGDEKHDHESSHTDEKHELEHEDV